MIFLAVSFETSLCPFLIKLIRDRLHPITSAARLSEPAIEINRLNSSFKYFILQYYDTQYLIAIAGKQSFSINSIMEYAKLILALYFQLLTRETEQ